MTTVDAILLAMRSTLVRFAALVRMLTAPERLLSLVLGLGIIVAIPRAILVGGWPAWSLAFSAALTAWLACPVLADALVVRERLRRTNDVLVTTNAVKPTGAPRVAEVPCRHGDMHRYLYDGTAWLPAGPAPDTRPEPEEART